MQRYDGWRQLRPSAGRRMLKPLGLPILSGTILSPVVGQTIDAPRPPIKDQPRQPTSRSRTGGTTGSSTGESTGSPTPGTTTARNPEPTTVLGPEPTTRDVNFHKPFGADHDFAFILIAVAIYALSVQLFNFSSKIQGWVLRDDKDAPPSESGWLVCVLSTTAIVALCFVRAGGYLPHADLLGVLASAPRDFSMGLLVASIVPSGLAASKVIGVYSSLRRMPDDDRKREGVGFAVGTALLGLINLAGSIATLVAFFGFQRV